MSALGGLCKKLIKSPLQFSAKFRCTEKSGPICLARVVRDAYIAKALIWSALSQNLQKALHGEVFRIYFEKPEFFNTINPKQ
ncbi:hypothetical protein SuNHUV7_25850 (plasmid) [Pseudoseohaeicola sp. NH-UV-7]